ncbi:MAG: hypothetical protein KC546_06510, partial [Anaerolineae bacterium]|nr:hypothetical protein [Anaerolineae bacterium]
SLVWAKAEYQSAAGPYESSWEIDGAGCFTLSISIPFNARATVVLPQAQLGYISLNDAPLTDAIQDGDTVTTTLGAGRYKLLYPLDTS